MDRQIRRPHETPEERFKRVATARTKAVLEKLRLLGKCSNRRLYDYSEDDVEKIFSAIEGQIKDIRAGFSFKVHKGWDIDL